jgi:hypothetical protein
MSFIEQAENKGGLVYENTHRGVVDDLFFFIPCVFRGQPDHPDELHRGPRAARKR